MTTDPAVPEAAPKASRRAVIMTWLKRVLLVVVLAVAVYQLVKQWPEVSHTLSQLPWPSVVLSFLAALLGILLGPMAWRVILADLGTPVRRTDASMIFLVGQLGKYIPGSVWAFLLQMELGKSAGITRMRAFTASLITTGLGIVASLVAGFLAMPVILDGHRELLWVFAPLPLGLILLHPRLLTWIVSRILRVLRRPPLPHPLSGKAILRNVGWALSANLLLGLHLWLLADALGSPGFSTFLLCTGAMALAMTTGVLAFFLPSGIGAREVVLVATLTTVMPSGSALALALVSRVMFTVVDLVSAGGAALLARAHKPQPAPDVTDPANA
ncbi:lysylphosphatidylglycerol synthase domain-containing protein [Actinocrispum sp. NPDC049592]|uniref:lysylphosphatidylglycerol synthase domain-containing protein n=1 Tax=Actinocrispum sp. NPDC049592 TaxID=3154835 RepID=UPI0034223A64